MYGEIVCSTEHFHADLSGTDCFARPHTATGGNVMTVTTPQLKAARSFASCSITRTRRHNGT